MAAALHVVRRTIQGVNDDRNLVREVLIHRDDADTDAQIITDTIAALNTAHVTGDGFSTGADVYPAGYFQTVDKVGLTPSETLATLGDFIAFAPAVASVET